MAAGRFGDTRRLFLIGDGLAVTGEMSLVVFLMLSKSTRFSLLFSFQITVMLNSFQYLSQVAAKP
jgi:hypothetical protein